MSAKYQIHEAHDLPYHVHFALSRCPFIGLNDVVFDVVEQDVILRGAVKTYYQKQMAQETVRSIAGVSAIRNELIVTDR